jgi:hypothetical protein
MFDPVKVLKATASGTRKSEAQRCSSGALRQPALRKRVARPFRLVSK